MENYQFPSTYSAISGLLDDVDNSKQWNFELWHYCIKATIYTYKTLVVLLAWLFEAVRTNPGYGMATLIYNNLLNLILGTVMLLRSNYIIQEKILLYLFK